jgi:hypothetical protein
MAATDRSNGRQVRTVSKGKIGPWNKKTNLYEYAQQMRSSCGPLLRRDAFNAGLPMLRDVVGKGPRRRRGANNDQDAWPVVFSVEASGNFRHYRFWRWQEITSATASRKPSCPNAVTIVITTITSLTIIIMMTTMPHRHH